MESDRIILFHDYRKNYPMTDQGSKDEDLISALAADISHAKDVNNVIRYLNKFKENNAKTIYNPKNGSYIYSNYYIVPGYYNEDAEFIKNLKLLTRLGFCPTSAPEIVSLCKTGNNNFGVLIYKLQNTKGGILLPYLQEEKSVPLENKEQFYQEQKSLLTSTSLYNPSILDSFDFWGITPDTKTIVIDSWGNLKKSDSKTKHPLILQRLRNILRLNK